MNGHNTALNGYSWQCKSRMRITFPAIFHVFFQTDSVICVDIVYFPYFEVQKQG